MAGKITVQVTGMKEFADLIGQMQDDFGEKDSRKILNKAVKKSMGNILDAAKSRAPVDTGGLRASLRLAVRKPSRKDKRSRYIENTDVVIGQITTAPGNVLAKLKYKNAKTGEKTVGVQSDARAIANEFGTANMGGKPFLRPAMESQSQSTVSSLAGSLRLELEKYKAKQTKKG
jgi:HK97 gp10 family phage protein